MLTFGYVKVCDPCPKQTFMKGTQSPCTEVDLGTPDSQESSDLTVHPKKLSQSLDFIFWLLYSGGVRDPGNKDTSGKM